MEHSRSGLLGGEPRRPPRSSTLACAPGEPGDRGGMAQAKFKPEKSARGGMGARTGLLAALLAVVAALAL